MTIVPAKRLSRAEMFMLGNNVYPLVERDRRGQYQDQELAAVNRSLSIHGEFVDELIPITEAIDHRRIA